MRDALKSYLALAGGVTDVTRQRALEAAKALVASGEAAAEQVSTLAEDLLSQTRQNREAVVALVGFEVDRALGRVGLATAEEVTELTARVRDLEAQLAAAASGSAATAKEAPAKEAPAKKASASQAPATKVPASKPAAQKPPAKEASSKKAPVKKAPSKNAPASKPAARQAPPKEAPAKSAPAKDAAASGAGASGAQQASDASTSPA